MKETEPNLLIETEGKRFMVEVARWTGGREIIAEDSVQAQGISAWYEFPQGITITALRNGDFLQGLLTMVVQGTVERRLLQGYIEVQEVDEEGFTVIQKIIDLKALSRRLNKSTAGQ